MTGTNGRYRLPGAVTLCLAWTLVAGCAEDRLIPATQVMVVVNSDLAPASKLVQVNVEVQDEAGRETRDQRTFSVSGAQGSAGLVSLPFSFSVVEPAQNAASRFRLVVTGWGPPAERGGEPTKLVRQTAIASFQRGLTVRLSVFLGQLCLQNFCADDLDRTCYPATSTETGAGECGGITVQDDLEQVKPGNEIVSDAWPSGDGGQHATSDASDGEAQAPARTDGGGSGQQAGAQTSDAGMQGDTPSGPSSDGGSLDAGLGNVGTQDAGGSSSDAGRPNTGSSDSGASNDAGHGGSQDAGQPRRCLENITNYSEAGPFQFTRFTSGSVKLWVPGVPSGCRVPVVHFANGTGAACSNYEAVLERLATHGFLSACYESANTGAGNQGLMALETARSLYPNLVDNKIASAGHSQGGQAAFITLQLAEAKWGTSMVYAGLSAQPASGFGEQPSGGTWQEMYGKVRSPMFVFNGTADTLVSPGWVQQAFNALSTSVEAYWWAAIGATHIPAPVSHLQQVSIPWFRWKLLGDTSACAAFLALPGGGQWQKEMARNEKACD